MQGQGQGLHLQLLPSERAQPLPRTDKLLAEIRPHRTCLPAHRCQLGLDWFLPRDAVRKRGLCCFPNPVAPSFQFF